MLREWNPITAERSRLVLRGRRADEERRRLTANRMSDPLDTPVVFRKFLSEFTESFELALVPGGTGRGEKGALGNQGSKEEEERQNGGINEVVDECVHYKPKNINRPKSENTTSPTLSMAKVGPSPDTSTSREDTMDFDTKSVHYEDQAYMVEMTGNRQLHKSKREREINFMKTKFSLRKCKCFIEREKQDDVEIENRLCGCRYKLSEHKKAVHKGVTKWTASRHTEKAATNAFGEIEFLGYGDKQAKYVRVEMETNMKSLLELLQDQWEIEKPTLLISVTGGAKKCNMKPRLKEVFKRGLKKAAESPGAWIVTGGSHAGVMSLVGEAVRDHDMMSKRSLVTIGIAPWGCVRNKDCLVDEKHGKYPACYSITRDDVNGETYLDPNHSHFILVDNGSQHTFGTEIELRTALEEAISNQKTDTSADGVSVPVCLLVLDGGVGTLETVHSALKKGTPTVVINGSGKVADILAYAVQNVTERNVEATDSEGRTKIIVDTYLEGSVLTEIERMVDKDLGKENINRHVEWIKECTKSMDKISVFELGSKNSAKEVDLAILKALLKANKSNVRDQLRLALCWNRIDVAKMEIFTEDRHWTTGSLDDAMMMALKLDRVEFIQLFLDCGVKLEEFLTEKRLLELYNSIPNTSILHKLLTRAAGRDKDFKLVDVEAVIIKLLGEFFKPGYPTNQKGDEAVEKDGRDGETTTFCGDFPAQDKTQFSEAQQLFIWAVLLNRYDMSYKFWMVGKESSAAALFAMSVLSKMVRETPDSELQRTLEINAEAYEQRAVEVVNACYTCDEVQTQDNLVRNMPTWGSTSSCLLAYHANNKKFLAQTAVQSLLNSKWRGEMELRNNYWKVLVCTLLPFLVPCLISFRDSSHDHSLLKTNKEHRKKQEVEEKESQKSSSDKEDIQKPLTAWKKIENFYRAPIVKFNLNVVFYFLFLTLYSYIMLVKMEDHVIHWLEYVLIAWVAAILADEIRQITTIYSFTFCAKLKYYFYDQWNILDIVTVSLFIVGISLRFCMTTETMGVSRVILNINLITFFLRVLHIFSINHRLGPMLVMISKMLKDLIHFVVILLVFVFAYAIASEAILYPNTQLSWRLLYYLPRKAYWQMYGEIILEELEGDSCTNDAALYSDYSHLRCPTEYGKYVVPILLGIYVMITSVLLLNLLIAMFSYTFQKIHEKSDMHWCYQRFSLVLEYVHKPVAPPPFILLANAWLLIKLAHRCFRERSQPCLCCVSCIKGDPTDQTLRRCCSKERSNSSFRKTYDAETHKRLIQWENVISDTHFSDKKDSKTIEGMISSFNRKIDNLTSKIDALQESQSQGAVVLQSQGHVSSVPAIPVVAPSDNREIIRRMNNIEGQLNQFSKAFDWIVQCLQDSQLTSGATPRPHLTSIEDQRKQVSQRVERHISTTMRLQYYSRSSPYPGTGQKRFNVPDHKVDWQVPFQEYNPSAYTSPHILDMPSYADEDIMALPAAQRNLAFNTTDKGVNRVSLVKPYRVEDGLPINPQGRTGLKGRGSLGRWGPNICGDPIVTRWKLKPDGSQSMAKGKPQLEFVSVQRKDNNLWSIPGSICEEDEEPWDILQTDFKEDVLGLGGAGDQEGQDQMNEELQLLSKQGREIYKGYADDPRNTDNAWLETRVINYHDADGSILKQINFRAGEDVQAVSWQTVSSKLTLHGGHSYFLKLVAKDHNAAF